MENIMFLEETEKFAQEFQNLLDKYGFTLKGSIGYSSAGLVVVKGEERTEIMEITEEGYNLYGVDHPNKCESF